MIATERPKKIRLSMVMDRDLHRRVRIEALERGESMREYVEGILARRAELDQTGDTEK